MFLKLATKLFGSSNERRLKSLEPHIEPINALEPKYEAMSDSELKNQTQLFRQRLEKGESIDNLMHEAFAVVREGSKRALGLRHYDVQLIGGVVLHQGDISEMKTGEGKTLVATLAVYLNALSGKGVHVVTVNDYLAKRDSEWMGKLYTFLGLSVGVIINGMDDEQRKKAYNCDVTYGTNNELGFDYLRDNMKFSLDQMVQRPFHYAIVDEVDSILIDEARTPLIISGPSESSQDLYVGVDKIIPFLKEEDYELDEKHKTLALSEQGQERVEQLLREHGLLTEGVLYDMHNIDLVLHTNQALKAHKLFKKDTDYIVKDNKVILIDEFTGRMKPDSRLSEGQHQAIEAKEGVPIMSENQTLASITYQNYFRLYPKLAGMTGTAMTEADEFHEIYKLGVVAIPTNEPIARVDYEDKIYKSLKDKDEAVIELIRECKERQQPVLVGTVSIEKSESLSATLKKQKIKHNVLNARHHQQEAQIIAQAGQPGAVTIATNMAGRGTDIQLGGNLEMRIAEEINDSWSDEKKNKAIEKIKSEIERNRQVVLDAGGLYVIGTERHESRRIDNQLRGRSGRQGDPGASMFFLSVEDDLMRRFAQDRMESLLNNKRIGLEDGEALEHPWISKLIQHAQTKVEQQHFEARKHILKYDDVMNDQRKVIYEQRREIMEASSLDETIKDMRHTTIEEIVYETMPPGTYAEQWNIDALQTQNQRLLGLDVPLKEWSEEEGIADSEMLERLIDASDKKMAEKAANIGSDLWRQVEKSVVLSVLDQYWKEHLLTLDHLRQGIGLRGLGQRDPLNEYKTEAFELFEVMLGQIREQITMRLSLLELDPEHISILSPQARQEEQEYQESRQDPALMGSGAMAQNQPKNQAQPFRHKTIDPNNPETWGKTPRNAPCPCKSGKKFKHCHGKILQSA